MTADIVSDNDLDALIDIYNIATERVFAPQVIVCLRELQRLRSGRAAVIEECAKVADEHAGFLHKEAHSGGDFHHLVARRTEATYLAQRIRALTGGPRD